MNRVPTRADLYATLPPGGVGAELGVLAGQNSLVLLERAQPAVLHLVDIWSGSYWAVDPADSPPSGSWTGDAARDKVIERMAPQIAAGQVRLHQSCSLAWLAAQPASSLDWCYLDGNHDYHHVIRELFQLLRVLKPGGWVCGHDYSAALPGVVAAVDQFCRDFGQAIEVLTDEEEQERPGLPPWCPRKVAFNSFAIRLQK